MENDNKTEENYEFEYKDDNLKCFGLSEKILKTKKTLKLWMIIKQQIHLNII